jgi:hypothetical protein
VTTPPSPRGRYAIRGGRSRNESLATSSGVLPTTIDPSRLTDIPPVTPESIRHAVRSLLASADQACTVAEHLEVLAKHGRPDNAGETVVASEQISRAIALLNEAQGALLFG